MPACESSVFHGKTTNFHTFNSAKLEVLIELGSFPLAFKPRIAAKNSGCRDSASFIVRIQAVICAAKAVIALAIGVATRCFAGFEFIFIIESLLFIFVT